MTDVKPFVNVDGEWEDVFKDPITDPGKTSMKGRLQLIKTLDGYSTVTERDWNHDILRPVFENGELLVNDTFNDVRVRANQEVHNFFSEAHCE